MEQWSRNLSVAEGGPEIDVAYKDQMLRGPRHDGRGGGDENDHAANDDLASMGPRPGDRGRAVPCALLSSVPVPRIFLPPPLMTVRPPCNTIVALQSRMRIMRKSLGIVAAAGC